MYEKRVRVVKKQHLVTLIHYDLQRQNVMLRR
ncbi:hypothetical protein Pvag_3722 [Pantoea vagans C9-1]|nr:hypothetical protein Pvag_3722 [Pantoea vagans C9-1]